MFLGPWHLIQALLFSLGVYWCYVVIVRFRKDLEELREVEDKIRKAVIVGIWALTVLIAIALVNFAIPVISRIVSTLPGLKVFF